MGAPRQGKQENPKKETLLSRGFSQADRLMTGLSRRLLIVDLLSDVVELHLYFFTQFFLKVQHLPAKLFQLALQSPRIDVVQVKISSSQRGAHIRNANIQMIQRLQTFQGLKPLKRLQHAQPVK